MPNLNEILDSNTRHIRAHGLGCSDPVVAEAEQTLGFSLPEDYRVFLSRLGWCEIAGGVYLFGLVNAEEPDQDQRASLSIIFDTPRLVTQYNLPVGLLRISDSFGEELHFLDCRAGGRVVMINRGSMKHGGHEPCIPVAHSFTDYVQKVFVHGDLIVREAEEDKRYQDALREPSPSNRSCGLFLRITRALGIGRSGGDAG